MQLSLNIRIHAIAGNLAGKETRLQFIHGHNKSGFPLLTYILESYQFQSYDVYSMQMEYITQQRNTHHTGETMFSIQQILQQWPVKKDLFPFAVIKHKPHSTLLCTLKKELLFDARCWSNSFYGIQLNYNQYQLKFKLFHCVLRIHYYSRSNGIAKITT